MGARETTKVAAVVRKAAVEAGTATKVAGTMVAREGGAETVRERWWKARSNELRTSLSLDRGGRDGSKECGDRDWLTMAVEGATVVAGGGHTDRPT